MLEAVKKEGEKAIEKTQKKIAKEMKNKKIISWGGYIIEKIKSSIFNLIKNDIILMLPPPHISADLSFSVFEAAKASGANPKELSAKIAEIINNSKNEFIERAEIAGAYVNLFLNKNKIYSLALSQTVMM